MARLCRIHGLCPSSKGLANILDGRIETVKLGSYIHKSSKARRSVDQKLAVSCEARQIWNCNRLPANLVGNSRLLKKLPIPLRAGCGMTLT